MLIAKGRGLASRPQLCSTVHWAAMTIVKVWHIWSQIFWHTLPQTLRHPATDPHTPYHRPGHIPSHTLPQTLTHPATEPHTPGHRPFHTPGHRASDTRLQSLRHPATDPLIHPPGHRPSHTPHRHPATYPLTHLSTEPQTPSHRPFHTPRHRASDTRPQTLTHLATDPLTHCSPIPTGWTVCQHVTGHTIQPVCDKPDGNILSMSNTAPSTCILCHYRSLMCTDTVEVCPPHSHSLRHKLHLSTTSFTSCVDRFTLSLGLLLLFSTTFSQPSKSNTLSYSQLYLISRLLTVQLLSPDFNYRKIYIFSRPQDHISSTEDLASQT